MTKTKLLRPAKGILQRFCKQCGKEYKKGYGRLCRGCFKENHRESQKKYSKRYHAENKEKRNKASVAWAKANPEKNRAKARAYLMRKKLAKRQEGKADVELSHKIIALRAKVDIFP